MWVEPVMGDRLTGREIWLEPVMGDRQRGRCGWSL